MEYKRIILFLVFGFAYCWANAQPYVSNNGFFEVDQVKGCASLTVNVTVRPPVVCNGATSCDMDYENNGQFLSRTFTHTYTQPGTYILKILFQTAGFDQITIVVAPNTQPAFEVYSCGGNAAQVKVTDTNYNQYVINYNDGSPDVVVPSGSLAKDMHTFVSPGGKNITVRGRNLGADDNCNPANQAINAVVTIPPPFIPKLQVVTDDSIKLDFNNQQNVLYKLEIATNSTAFQQLKNIYNANTTVVGNLRTDDNYYCFRLGAFDPCNNTIVYSNVICSSNFDAIPQSDLNSLTWATNAIGVSNYSITKSNNPSLTATALQTSLNDANVICGTDYCYQMTNVYANGSQSISLEKCATAFSTKVPTTTKNISIRITGANSLDLSWLQDPLFTPAEYNIFKSGSPFGTSALQTFTDSNFVQEDQPCYSISYTDACGNKSLMSIAACPILLNGTLQADNAINLNWSDYNGWENGVDHYIVEKFDTQGQLLQTFNTGTGLSLTDDEEDINNQIYVYRITAFAVTAGVVESISNTLTIIKEPNLFHPNAFTPNSDGLNDTFKVIGQYTAQVEFKIFNRWGELLFITTDLNQSWDGTYKGNLMPEGTYVFRAYLTDLAGRTSERSGNILLLRKR